MIEFLRKEFDRLWPVLERAVKHGGHRITKQYAWEQIEAGKAQLWPLPNSAVVTEIQDRPNGEKIVLAWLAGGKWKEINHVLPMLEDWARSEGCVRIEADGRRGFIRAAGFVAAGPILIKEL